MQETLILVNQSDQPVGYAEKMFAHERGLLHRAFSVFIFNARGEVLLQKRAYGKYHSGGLLTNACCGHPRAGEDTHTAAKRRLFEETGIVCDLAEAGSFIYEVAFGNGLFEHEFDHVFIGYYDGEVSFNRSEIENCIWVSPKRLSSSLRTHASNYTYWLREALDIAVSAHAKEALESAVKRPFSELLLTYKTLFARMFLP